VHTLGLGAIALTLLGAFLARQATAANPLIPLRVFRSRSVTGANLAVVMMVAGMFGMFFLGSLYLQRVLGFSAMQIGLAFLPVSMGIGTLSLGFSARLTMRFGPRNVLLPGLTLMMAGLALLTRAPAGGSYPAHVLPSMLLLGIGAGLSFPSLAQLAMAGATPADAGLRSGLLNTAQQVGGALGLAVLATLSTSRTGSLLAQGESTAPALTGGYHLAFGIGAVLLLSAITVAITVLRPRTAAESDAVVAGELAIADAA
jgi:predicted MFS family arabinose efflux permease